MLSSLSTGSAVTMTGIWKASPPGKTQTHELDVTGVELVGAMDPEVGSFLCAVPMGKNS